MSQLLVFYRISDGGNPKPKVEGKSARACLENAISIFGSEGFHVLADRCKPETLAWLQNLDVPVQVADLGNAGSFRKCAEWALASTLPESSLYFLEDDYWHLSGSKERLLDGLELADYVSLYDHPDKYRPGENPFVEHGGELCRLLLGKTGHWKTSNSTTMTFAVKASTFSADWPHWQRFLTEGYPNDFQAFLFLQNLGSWENRIWGGRRKLITAVPGMASHLELAHLSPLHNWHL